MLLERAKAFIGSSSAVRGVTAGAVERSTGLVVAQITAGSLEPLEGLEDGTSALGAGEASTGDASEDGLMAKVGVTVDASLTLASGDALEAANCSRRFLAPKKISGQRIGISCAERNHGPGTLSGKLGKNKAGFWAK